MARISQTQFINIGGVNDDTEILELKFGQRLSRKVTLYSVDPDTKVRTIIDLTTATALTGNIVRRTFSTFSQSGARIAGNLKPFVNLPITTAVQSYSSLNQIKIANTSNTLPPLSVGQVIQFWGEPNGVEIGLTLGTNYYITSIKQNNLIQVSATSGGTPISLSSATINYSIVSPSTATIPLNVSFVDRPNGIIRIVIDGPTWTNMIMANDAELIIDAAIPAVYTGNVTITLPDDTGLNSVDLIQEVIILARSNGVNG